MIKQQQALFDFNETVGQDKLTIYGGRIKERQVLQFLKTWHDKGPLIPYRLWEYTDSIVLEKETWPAINNEDEIFWFEMGRMFGETADVLLRRERNYFSWVFIGDRDVWRDFLENEISGFFNGEEYWQANRAVSYLLQEENEANLWGRRSAASAGQWVDNRVAGACLRYPVEGEQARISYRIYSFAGQVQFVRYTGLLGGDQ